MIGADEWNLDRNFNQYQINFESVWDCWKSFEQLEAIINVIVQVDVLYNGKQVPNQQIHVEHLL